MAITISVTSNAACHFNNQQHNQQYIIDSIINSMILYVNYVGYGGIHRHRNTFKTGGGGQDSNFSACYDASHDCLYRCLALRDLNSAINTEWK